MGFDLSGAVNSAADWACGLPVARGVIGNPVYTALLIVAIVVVVAMGLYSGQVKKAGTKKALRAVIYLFFAVLAVTFVHHYAVVRDARRCAAQQGVREVFSGLDHNLAGVTGGVPVTPMGVPGTPAGALPGDRSAASVLGDRSAASVSGGRERPDNIFSVADVVVPSALRPAWQA